mmetsp:Transcript_43159/g.102415  ORF Transcript_43159/g.102415 Transcript_43159/m.102415 type:complete len:193 (-) Transcript_43159:278-856(-)
MSSGSPDEAEANAAATKIQAVHRGRTVRKQTAKLASSSSPPEAAAANEAAGDVPAPAGTADSKPDTLPLRDGLAPPEVGKAFFKAVEDKNYDVWLQTLHMECRSHPSSRAPGPFSCNDWELLRERVRKHSVSYRLDEEKHSLDGLHVMLRYAPLYGDVPGYDQGERLVAKDTVLELEREGAEWRVMAILQTA